MYKKWNIVLKTIAQQGFDEMQNQAPNISHGVE